MSFRMKISLTFLLLLSLCLSLNALLTIKRNFDDALERSALAAFERQRVAALAVERAYAGYVAQQYEAWRRETDLYEPGSGERFHPERCSLGALEQATLLLGEQADGGTCGFAIADEDGRALCDCLPDGLPADGCMRATALGADEYELAGYGGRTFLLVNTPLAVSGSGASLAGAYDVSDVWASRAAQLRCGALFSALTIAAGLPLVWAAASRLTKPVKRLEAASGRIALGHYDERTGIETDDEIGSLARAFDEMAAQTERQVAELKRSAERQEEFVAAFAHELKTPMASMLGYASLLSQGLEEGQREAAQQYIYSETRRLEALSQNLLTLVGIKNGGMAPGRVSVRELFEALVKTLPADKKGVAVETEAPGDVLVAGDAVLLDCLLRNLVLNAVNACGGGGVVRLACRVTGDGAELSVSDNGCGIPAEELDRITEAFYRVDRSRSRAQGSSGLGLSIAKRIASLHGAKLAFESEQGRGTRVSFTLPLAQRGEEDVDVSE